MSNDFAIRDAHDIHADHRFWPKPFDTEMSGDQALVLIAAMSRSTNRVQAFDGDVAGSFGNACNGCRAQHDSEDQALEHIAFN